MIVVLVVIAVVAVVGLWLALRRGPRSEPGMVSFQRHIDALSPEARRQVRDHLQTDASGADVVDDSEPDDDHDDPEVVHDDHDDDRGDGHDHDDDRGDDRGDDADGNQAH